MGTPPPFEKPRGRTGAERGRDGPAGRAGARRLACVFSEDWRGVLEGRGRQEGRTNLNGLFVRQCLPSERPQETVVQGCQKNTGCPLHLNFK